jgi:hypothetical protein
MTTASQRLSDVIEAREMVKLQNGTSNNLIQLMIIGTKSITLTNDNGESKISDVIEARET